MDFGFSQEFIFKELAFPSREDFKALNVSFFGLENLLDHMNFVPIVLYSLAQNFDEILDFTVNCNCSSNSHALKSL